MDEFFKSMIDTYIPKFNPIITEGLASSQLKNVEKYLEDALRPLFKTSPKELRFIGLRRLTPSEEYRQLILPCESRLSVDLARYDLYMVELEFTYNGEPVTPPIYLYLPFCKYGVTHFKGTAYQITPVLTDSVISINPNYIFVKLLQIKLQFERIYHNYYAGDAKVTSSIVWGNIYKIKDNMVKTNDGYGSLKTTLIHYLLGKYGLRETFRKYLEFIPIVGRDEINTDTYPTDKWVICSSTNVVPKKFKGTTYIPHNIRIAIPIENYDIFTSDVVGGIFYVLDNFTDKVDDISALDNPDYWVVLLGLIIFSGNFSYSVIYSKISTHYNNMDEYMDKVTKKMLSDSGMYVDDVYDLLTLVLKNFSDWVIDNGNGNVKTKYMEVMYYIMFNIIERSVKATYELQRVHKAGTLTMANASNILRKHLRTRSILRLITGGSMNLAIQVVNCSTDERFTKITSLVALQNTGRGVEKSGRVALPSDAKTITADALVAGTPIGVKKKLPTPAVTINPFADIDPETGKIIINPKHVKVLKELDVLLTLDASDDYDEDVYEIDPDINC